MNAELIRDYLRQIADAGYCPICREKTTASPVWLDVARTIRFVHGRGRDRIVCLTTCPEASPSISFFQEILRKVKAVVAVTAQQRVPEGIEWRRQWEGYSPILATAIGMYNSVILREDQDAEEQNRRAYARTLAAQLERDYYRPRSSPEPKLPEVVDLNLVRRIKL